MTKYIPPPMTDYFITISDPRLERQKVHPLINIIVMAVCAVIAGCDSWVEIGEFAKSRKNWFATFLELPPGEDVPSHDTFGRVFSLIDPKQFQSCFSSWMQSVVLLTKGQVIAIDGKTNRRTFGGKGKDGILYINSV